MDLFQFLIDYSSVIIAIVNVILVIFVLIQIRDSRKPVIFTKLLTRKQEVEEKPGVLVSDFPYLAIINGSDNIAKKLSISYQFTVKEHTIHVNEPFLHHLNPNEATKFVLKIQAIRHAYPDLFDSVSEGNKTLFIPKETLRINLDVKIGYNPVVLSGFGYQIKDNYYIEWGSLTSYPQFKDHPRFDCWNKRDGEYYIYKLSGRSDRKEKVDSEYW